MKKKKEYRDCKKNLAIGVSGGFVSGGTLVAYQFLLPYGLLWAFLGSIIVGLIIWKIAVESIKKNFRNKI